MIVQEEFSINDNFCIIRFLQKKEYFLIRNYPFALFEIDEITKNNLIDKKFSVEDIFPETILQKKKNIFIEPGYFFQPLFIMTTNCNLACKYCYADKGSYGYGIQNISQNAIDNTIAYIEKKIKSLNKDISNYKNIEIAFVAFGGESLLNFEMIKYLILKAKKVIEELSNELNIYITPLVIINTNGILLTEKLLIQLEPYKNIIEFVVSFDGLFHDINRLKHNKSGSAQDTINAIHLLKKEKYHFYITCCLLPEYLIETKRNVKYITELFGKDTTINLSFIRGALHSLKERISYPGLLQQSYSSDNIEIFTNQVCELIENGYEIFTNKLKKKIQAGGFINKCAACLYEFCVTPNGDVFPCHNFIDDHFKLGNINIDSFDITNENSIYKRFYDRRVDKIEACSTCFLKTICISSFDCPSHSLFDLNDFDNIDNLICKAGKDIQAAILKRFIYNNFK